MATGEGNEQEFVEKLIQITLANLAHEHFGGKELALQAGMSLSTLNRRLQRSHQKSSNCFIRDIRLHKAMELLQQSPATASEIAFSVGFGSPAYFSKCFNDHFGFPPGEVRKKLAELAWNPLEKSNPFPGIAKKRSFLPASPGRVSIPFPLALSIILILLILIFLLGYLLKKADLVYLPEGLRSPFSAAPF